MKNISHFTHPEEKGSKMKKHTKRIQIFIRMFLHLLKLYTFLKVV